MLTAANVQSTAASGLLPQPGWIPARAFEYLSNPRTALILVALLACVVRFGALLTFGPITRLEGDTPSYVTPAIRLADGLGYTRVDGTPAMKRSPGFPMQVTLSKWLTGNLYLAHLLNAVWGAVAVLGVYALGVRAFGGPLVGAVAAIIYAVLPQPIYWQRLLLSESLHTMLIVLWALAALAVLERGSWARSAVAGLTLAVMLYVRPASILLLVSAPALALLFRSTRKAAGWLLLSSIVATLAILPWSVRNYRASGMVIPLATGFGAAAYLGNLGDGGSGGFDAEYPGAPVPDEVIRRFQEAETRSDWEADAYARSLVPGLIRDRLSHDPWTWLVKAKVANLSRFFFGRPFAVPSPWWTDLQSAVIAAGLTLTALSFPALARRVSPRGPLVFCWILVSLLSIHVATTSVRRYSEAVLPFLALGSGAALIGFGPVRWGRTLARPRAGRVAVIGGSID